jgi:hypothetical protein
MSLPDEYEIGPVLPAAGKWARRESRARREPRSHRGLVFFIAVIVLVALCIVAWLGTTGFAYRSFPESVADSLDRTLAKPPQPPSGTTPEKFVTQLTSEGKKLRSSLQKFIPKGVYIVIDQTHNRLYLKRGTTVTLEAVCSAGSGMVLKEGGGKNRTWVFETPRGVFSIKRRVDNPVWTKPDWAFVEEGKPIPKRRDEREEYGMLGEYALHFGNGYMIHGTLYERLLGRSVTHGCIRLGRDNLRQVVKDCPIGTPLYVY